MKHSSWNRGKWNSGDWNREKWDKGRMPGNDTGKMRLSKSQRMQIKALICVLGILLLLILLLGRLVFLLLQKEPKPEDIIHIPVVEQLTNVWIMEAKEDSLMIFRDGVEETYSYGTLADETIFTPQKDAREQIADVELTDGKVTDIALKTDKINGKILSADSSSVEVEGYGRLPLATDYKGYRIYNSLAMCDAVDLIFGYNFADLVMEKGSICGILMVKEEAMEYIRVLVKASDYSGMLHESLTITADTDYIVQYGKYGALQQEEHKAGEEIVIESGSPYFAGERVWIVPGVLTGKIILKNVNRSQGIPAYRGHMELTQTPDGISVVNEVLLEEYLYSVVPSEMPASYPEEALKAQAVCARTYAYGHMQRAGYPKYGAHVDDSTSYQVYNNILEQESTTTAAKETYGQLLFTAEGSLAGTYYYSTSCGEGSDATVWKTEEAQTLTYLKPKSINRNVMEEYVQTAAFGSYSDLSEKLKNEENFAAFIRTKDAEDFEVSEGWYRWSYQTKKLDTEHMYEILQKRYGANEKLVLTLVDGEYISQPIENFVSVTALSIAARGAGGIAEELLIETDSNTYKVVSEHNIRYVLNDGESKVLRQDGSEIASPSILPSGFFILSPSKEKENVIGYTLTGGGFGHGVGMSQNAAKAMAKSGYMSDQILGFFYENCKTQCIYDM